VGLLAINSIATEHDANTTRLGDTAITVETSNELDAPISLPSQGLQPQGVPPEQQPEPSVSETLSIVRQLLEAVERRARSQAEAGKAEQVTPAISIPIIEANSSTEARVADVTSPSQVDSTVTVTDFHQEPLPTSESVAGAPEPSEAVVNLDERTPEPQAEQAEDSEPPVLTQAAESQLSDNEQMDKDEVGLPSNERPTITPVATPSQDLLLVVRPVDSPEDAEYLVNIVEQQPEVEHATLQGFETGVATYKIIAKDRSKLVLGVMRWQQLRARNVRIIPDRIELTLAQPVQYTQATARVITTGLETAETETTQEIDCRAGETDAHPVESMETPPDTSSAQPIPATLTADVDVFFNARHYVILEGRQGPVHPHSWRVQARITGEVGQERTVLMPFAEAKRLLQDAVNRYNNTLLNEVHPFDKIQPTPENLADALYHDLSTAFGSLPVHLAEVSVWESPTSRVAYYETAVSKAPD
jgi:6-pyruvoyl-tetrahydropterin synthase